MKILIAENDPLSSGILRRSIEDAGHEVIATVDGAEAWERVQRGDIHLVISDRTLPRLDGTELCRRIRDSSRGEYIYVILLSARSQSADRIEGFRAGADDFLVKPIDHAELIARIRIAERILGMQEVLRTRALALESLHAALEQQNARLAEFATRDDLTGLKNRRHFREALQSGYAFAARHQMPLSLVMIDVDHFKPYNDRYGHPAGDTVLAELAGLLCGSAREQDLVARYGGEEFVILLPATGVEAALGFCERIRALIAGHPWPLRPITASFGIATSRPQTADAAQLIHEADRALYLSKDRGRNGVTHHLDVVRASA